MTNALEFRLKQTTTRRLIGLFEKNSFEIDHSCPGREGDHSLLVSV